MSFSPIHLSPSGAEIYYSGAYADATGATGAAGEYASIASAQGWNTVTFKNAATRVGIGSALPTGDSVTSSVNYSLAPAVIIGGATPIGDVRGEGTGYIPQGGGSTVVPLKPNELYSGALYAVYSVAGMEKLTAKVGVGTASFSNYYQGNFTTRDNYNFNTTLIVDTGNFNQTGLGSGVYTIGETITLQTSLVDRIGNSLNTVSSINEDSFVKGINISILNEDRTVVYGDYKTDYKNPSFTFTKQENIDLFGSFTQNFGVRFDVENQDGGTHSTDFLLYGNRLSINKIYVSASGGTYLDENPDNDFGPSTDDIIAAGDKLEAVVGFSHRLINTSGTTGAINFNLTFDQTPNFTDYEDLLVFANTGSAVFDTTTDNLLGTFPLSQLKNQNIRVFPDDGVVEGEANFFKFVASSKVGFYNELFTVGPYTIQPVELGTDPILYNVGEQEIVSGNLSILGDGAGGLYALGASGTGDGQRITGPGRLPYLLSGDSPAETQNLQQVTDIGNTTTNSIISSGPYVSGVTGYFNFLGIGTTVSFDPFTGIALREGPIKGYRIGAVETLVIDPTATNGGSVSTKATDGTLSTELGSDSNKRGTFKLKNAGGDEDRVTATVDGNDQGSVVIKDSSENNSVTVGSTSARRGIITIADPAGTTRVTATVDSNEMGELELLDSSANTSVKAGSDSSRHGFITIVDASDVIKSKIDANTSNDSFINVPSVGIGTNAVAASNSFEVFGNGAINSTLVVAGGASAGFVGIGSSSPTLPLDASTIGKANIAARNSYIYSTGSAIFGGANHIISGDYDVIAGGAKANISGGNFNFIGGGSGINVDHSTYSSSVGGFDNDVFSGSYSVIGGGISNLISGKASESHSDNSAILGGQQNKIISAPYSFIGGGNSNLITGTSAIYSAILGGNSSHITNSQYGVILAGDNNKINYANTALAAGNYSIVQSGHHGAFVLSDSRTAEYQSTGGNTLNLRFQSGVFVDTDSGIYINGNPVMTGASDEDTDTLQTVTDRGNTTTTSITSTGPHISGGTGLFGSDLTTLGKLAVGCSSSVYQATIHNTLQVKDVGGTYDGMRISANVGGEARIAAGNTDHGTKHPLKLKGEYLNFTAYTGGAEFESMRIVQGPDGSGRVGINTDDPDYHLDIHTSSNDQGIRLYAAQSTRTAAELLIDSATNGNAEFRMYHGTVLNTRIRSNVAAPTYFNAGNVGIGTNAPLTKLDVRGDVSGSGSFLGTGAGNRITNNNVPYLLSGDAATALTLQDVTDNGNTTTNSVYIHGSGDGANYAPLNVSGDQTLAFFRGTGTSAFLQFQNSTTTHGLSSREGLTIGNNGNDAYITQREAAPLYLMTSGEPRMTILGDSATHTKVGIGTVSPASTAGSDSFLEIYGATDAGLVISSNNGEWDLKNINPSANLNLYAAGSHRVTFAYAGNVGIGSQAPAYKLDVAGDIQAKDSFVTVGFGASEGYQFHDLGTGYGFKGIGSPTRLGVLAQGIESMTFESNGRVGIGSTNPANYKLEVIGDISGSGSFFGTGAGGRITNNNVPYLLSGDAAAALTLQDVTDNGNVTTTDITAANITGTGNLNISKDTDAYAEIGRAHVGYIGHSDYAGFSHIDRNNGSDYALLQDQYGTTIINSAASKQIRFGINNANVGVWDSAGKFGIGTDAPAYPLDVQAAAAEIAQIKRTNGGNCEFLINPVGGDAKVVFQNSGTDIWAIGKDNSDSSFRISEGGALETNPRFTVDNGGHVGIGTTNPSNKLHVEGSVNGNVKALIENTNTGSSAYATLGFQNDLPHSVHPALFLNGTNNTNYAGANSLNMYQYGSYNLGFVTNNLLRMTVSGNGNVGIGTNAPATLLDVDGAANHGIRIGTNNTIIGEGGATGTQLLFWNGTSAYYGRSAAPFTHTVSNHFFRVGGNDAAMIGSAGVGIGTITPAQKLHVEFANTDTSFAGGGGGDWGSEGLLIENTSSNTSTMAMIQLRGGDADIHIAGIRQGTNDSDLGFFFEGSEKVRFTNDGKVGIGTNSPSNALDVVGHFSATSKSFLIDHPTKENKKLQYGSLEGPENGVYVRGTTNSKIIKLPDYWSELVHEDSITVVLTPIGKKQDLYIKSKTPENVMIGGVEGSYDYVVYGERKDVAKLEIEPLKV